jgi:hypothetical protein
MHETSERSQGIQDVRLTNHPSSENTNRQLTLKVVVLAFIADAWYTECSAHPGNRTIRVDGEEEWSDLDRYFFCYIPREPILPHSTAREYQSTSGRGESCLILRL